jgi:Ca2+-binding RTX toxin-like protein
LLKKSRPARQKTEHGRFLPQLEPLDARVMPAVTASFTAAGALLRVVGDALDNTVVVSRDAGGAILVNGGAVPIQGDTPTVANTHMIMMVGGAGDDNLSLDETNGPMPAASLFGGDGNDVLTGGSGDDFVEGGAGNDTAFLGAGDDTFQWDPGDGSDTVEGQGGRDALTFTGSDSAERFDLSANGDRARFTRDVGGVTMDLGGVEEIDLSALGGADTITVNDQSATGLNTFNVDLTGSAGTGDGQADAVIINGTAGDDVGQIGSIGSQINATVSPIPFVHITGSEGANDTLTVNTLGGNDRLDASDLFATNASQLIRLTVNGGAGNDTLTGSPGADTFVWNPGDGHDTIEGGDGEDTMIVNGSDVSEKFDVSANGSQVRVTRDVDGGTTDLGGVEEIDVNPLGGPDTVTVNDLTGTAVTEIHLNLAGSVGGAAGDGQADSVIVNGTDRADMIPVIGHNGVIVVDGGFPDGSGLPYFLVIRAAEGANDTLTVNAQGGNDTVDASDLDAGLIGLTVIGGAGNDTIVGSPGDDTFVWNPGDGSDTIDGQAGLDKLTFNGSDAAENVVISRDGSHVRLTSDAGNVTMDLNAVDGIELNALGGADTITVNDLTGTGLVKVQVNLGGPAGGGDGQADSVVVNGTNGDDAVRVAAAGSTVLLDGLFPLVRITGSDGTTDHLTVNTLGGNDAVDSSGLPANLIGLTVNLDDGPAATTTTLRTSAPIAVVGQAVTFTATVTAVAPGAGTPTGTVTFLDGATVLGTAAVGADGRAALTTSFTSAGGHVITVVYSGDGTFAGSSQAVTEQVSAPPALAPTTTALTASARRVRKGQTVRFTATVRGGPGAGTPTGTVSFLVGKVVARVTLDAAGRASFTRRFAARGRFVIRAVYSGDSTFAGNSQSLVARVHS